MQRGARDQALVLLGERAPVEGERALAHVDIENPRDELASLVLRGQKIAAVDEIAQLDTDLQRIAATEVVAGFRRAVRLAVRLSGIHGLAGMHVLAGRAPRFSATGP